MGEHEPGHLAVRAGEPDVSQLHHGRRPAGGRVLGGPLRRTRITRFGQPLPLDRPLATLDEIVLDHRDSFFSLELVALDFTDLTRTRYAYRMEGFERGWVQCGTRNFASYTNLDPGRYVFRVKAAGSDGVWNRAGASLAVRILPPKADTRVELEAGVAHFLDAEIERAVGCFDRVLAENPEDQAAQRFAERGRLLLRTGPPPDWSPVEAMESK